MKEIEGDIFEVASRKEFQVITHGCNCFCTQTRGVATEMALKYDTRGFRLEQPQYRGEINKLGNYECKYLEEHDLFVINAYTQFEYGSGVHVDYEALALCLRKINNQFIGLSIGIPRIGCGSSGGDWGIVREIIKKELKDMNVTVVYLPNGTDKQLHKTPSR